MLLIILQLFLLQGFFQLSGKWIHLIDDIFGKAHYNYNNSYIQYRVDNFKERASPNVVCSDMYIIKKLTL